MNKFHPTLETLGTVFLGDIFNGFIQNIPFFPNILVVATKMKLDFGEICGLCPLEELGEA